MKAAPLLTLRGRDYFGNKGLHGLGIITGSKVQRRKREELASEGAESRPVWPSLPWKVESGARSYGMCRKRVLPHGVQVGIRFTTYILRLCPFSVTSENGSFSTSWLAFTVTLLVCFLSVSLIWEQGNFYRSSSLLILPPALFSLLI